MENQKVPYNIVEPPPGYSSPGMFATRLDQVVGLARKNSIWPLPFATSCCGIEFMATMGAHYDLGRFGEAQLLTQAGRPAYGYGNNSKKDGTYSSSDIRTDGRTPLGDRGGSLRS